MWIALSLALANSTTVTIEVVDGAGQPIPGAMVRLPAEDQLHLTHKDSGRWSSTAIHLKDGSEIAFGRFSTLRFQAVAPGFKLGEGVIVLARGRNLKRIRLQPHTLPKAVNDRGRQAIADHQAWRDAFRAYLADPRTLAEVQKTELKARESAREWYHDGGNTHAMDLCLLTGTLNFCR